MEVGHMPPQATTERLTLDFPHRFTPETRRMAEDYIARVNERQAPAKLTLRDLINAALVEYVERREEVRLA